MARRRSRPAEGSRINPSVARFAPTDNLPAAIGLLPQQEVAGRWTGGGTRPVRRYFPLLEDDQHIARLCLGPVDRHHPVSQPLAGIDRSGEDLRILLGPVIDHAAKVELAALKAGKKGFDGAQGSRRLPDASARTGRVVLADRTPLVRRVDGRHILSEGRSKAEEEGRAKKKGAAQHGGHA